MQVKAGSFGFCPGHWSPLQHHQLGLDFWVVPRRCLFTEEPEEGQATPSVVGQLGSQACLPPEPAGWGPAGRSHSLRGPKPQGPLTSLLSPSNSTTNVK